MGNLTATIRQLLAANPKHSLRDLADLSGGSLASIKTIRKRVLASCLAAYEASVAQRNKRRAALDKKRDEMRVKRLDPAFVLNEWKRRNGTLNVWKQHATESSDDDPVTAARKLLGSPDLSELLERAKAVLAATPNTGTEEPETTDESAPAETLQSSPPPTPLERIKLALGSVPEKLVRRRLDDMMFDLGLSEDEAADEIIRKLPKAALVSVYAPIPEHVKAPEQRLKKKSRRKP